MTEPGHSQTVAAIGQLREYWARYLSSSAQTDGKTLAELLNYYVPSKVGERPNSSTRMPAIDLLEGFLTNPELNSFLLSGDSGSGKSFFSMWLVNYLWTLYETEQSMWVPIYISLSELKDIDANFLNRCLKRQYGLRTHTRQALKEHRQLRLLLILDGYDELSHTLHRKNIYRLGKLYEWPCKVIISCRSELLAHLKEGQLHQIFSPYNHQLQMEPEKLIIHFIQPFQFETDVVDYVVNYLSINSDLQLRLRYEEGDFSASELHTSKQPSKYTDFRIHNQRSFSTNPSLRQYYIQHHKFKKVIKDSAVMFKRAIKSGFNPRTLNLMPPAIVRQIKNELRVDVGDRSTERIHKGDDSTDILTEDIFEGSDTASAHKSTSLKELPPSTIFLLNLIETLPGVRELISNPFALQLVLDTLPTLWHRYSKESSLDRLTLTRYDLYEEFTANWFARQKAKALASGQIDDLLNIEEDYKSFCYKLAGYMWQTGCYEITHQADLDASTYSDIDQVTMFPEPAQTIAAKKDRIEINHYLASTGTYRGDPRKPLHLVRQGCPLTIRGNTYQFIHPSLIEFFASQEIFKGAKCKASIALGIELNTRIFTMGCNESKFAADKLARDHELETALWALIEDSKHEHRVQIAAANAATILNAAHRVFSHKNFRRARIPGADLTGANLDYATFEEANLQNVNLTKASLNYTKLDGACVEGVVWGEEPPLQTQGKISAIRMSPDEKHLIVRADFNVEIYTWPERRLVNIIEGGGLRAIAISPCGSQLALGTRSGEISIHTFPEGNKIKTFIGHSGQVTCLDYHPSGTRLASSSADKTIRIWNVEEDSNFILRGHTDLVSCISFSPCGEHLASGSADTTVRIWRLKDASHTKLEGHEAIVWCLAYSPNGNLLASGGGHEDRSIRLWDIESETHQVLRGHITLVSCIAFLKGNKNILFSSGADGTVRYWNLLSFDTHLVGTHTKSLESITIANQSILAGSIDKHIYEWNQFRPKLAFYEKDQHTAHISGLIFTDKSLISGSHDGTLRIWDLLTRSSRLLYDDFSPISCILHLPDTPFIVTGDENGVIKIWNSQSRMSIKIEAHAAEVMSVAYNPISHHVASGGADDKIRIWDHEGTPINERSTDGAIKCMAFTPNGSELIFGDWGNRLYIWELESDSCVMLWRKLLPGAGMNCIACRSDGRQAAVGVINGTIQLWNIHRRKQQYVLKEHTAALMCIAYSTDSQQLLSGSQDKTFKVWNPNTGKCLHTEKLTTIPVSATWGVSDAGIHTIFVGGIDGSIRQWYWKPETSHKLEMVWQTHRTNLQTHNLHAAGLVGGSQKTLSILHARGAVSATCSVKSPEQVLRDRSAKLPYEEEEGKKHSSIFAIGNMHPSPDIWVITLARKKADHGNERHAFMILESVEDGLHVIRRIDFFVERRFVNSFFGVGYIEIAEKNYNDMNTLAEQCVYLPPREITRQQGIQLLENIRRDQVARLNYCLLGDGLKYRILRLDATAEQHNCLTWCIKQLAQIGIDDIVQTKWYDKIVPYTPAKIPDPDEPTTGKCSLM